MIIQPRPPVRAFALAAALAVVGGGLVVAASAWGWSVIVVVLGVVLLVLAAALVAVGFAAMVRGRVTVELDEHGYRVVEPGGRVRQGTWPDVTRVTTAPGRLTLHHGDERRTILLGRDADLEALGAQISRRLDDDRGYRTFEG